MLLKFIEKLENSLTKSHDCRQQTYRLASIELVSVLVSVSLSAPFGSISIGQNFGIGTSLIESMENEEFVKKVYLSNVEGPDRRRRLLGRWEDRVKEYMSERGVRGNGLCVCMCIIKKDIKVYQSHKKYMLSNSAKFRGVCGVFRWNGESYEDAYESFSMNI